MNHAYGEGIKIYHAQYHERKNLGQKQKPQKTQIPGA
jgi:hypothetical protein